MKILIDTHCLLWALARPEALNVDAAALLSNVETEVIVSAASIWEIAIKSALGKLRVSLTNRDSLFDIIDRQPLTPLPILHSHARQVASLPPQHGDPFDRLLIAQARYERLTLVTADEKILRYGGDMLDAR